MGRSSRTRPSAHPLRTANQLAICSVEVGLRSVRNAIVAPRWPASGPSRSPRGGHRLRPRHRRPGSTAQLGARPGGWPACPRPLLTFAPSARGGSGLRVEVTLGGALRQRYASTAMGNSVGACGRSSRESGMGHARLGAGAALPSHDPAPSSSHCPSRGNRPLRRQPGRRRPGGRHLTRDLAAGRGDYVVPFCVSSAGFL